MRPESPWIIRRLREIIYPDVVLLRIETYFQHLDKARSTPQDSRNSILDFPVYKPLLDAYRHGRLIDRRRTVIPGQFRHTLLMRSPSELLHLRRRRSIFVDKGDRVYPFYAGASVPSGYNQPDRRSVVFRKRLPVHLSGQKGLGSLHLLACKDPVSA